MEADTYAESYAMVLSGGGADGLCCTGFPQIMSPERRARFFAFRPIGMPAVPYFIGRNQEVRDKRPPFQSVIVDGLFNAFLETMQTIGQQPSRDDDLSLC